MKKKICMISAPGGHLEQIKQLKDVLKKYNCFYVTIKNPATSAMKEKCYLTTEFARINKVVLSFNMILWFVQEGFIFLKERPDVIISTGAANAVPMCLIGKIFGKKIIFIETFAHKKSPSKTGRIMYKFADLFIVQWPELLKDYPKAVYGGWIY